MVGAVFNRDLLGLAYTFRFKPLQEFGRFHLQRPKRLYNLTNQPINDLTPGKAVSNCLLNKIREHEYPVHFLFRINKRLQIFSQATEIQLGAPQKQSVTQLFFISDGHFSIQIIKIHPGFSQRVNNIKKVAADRLRLKIQKIFPYKFRGIGQK